MDIPKAIKRVKMDIRDDWFQDPLKYEDILTPEYIVQKLDGNYSPGNALQIDIPKPGFTSRYSTEVNIIDRVAFQALIDLIADHYDELHSNHIYSHRLNRDRRDAKYFFKYAVEEWKKFLSDTSLELRNGTVLLLADLSNFYENIGIEDLCHVLELLAPRDEREADFRACINLIKKLLGKWCERNTKRGIPQNRDASSFLANIFLHPVDDAMLKAGLRYFRYMDDIRIVCQSKYEARKALKKLITELRKKGLNVNSKKTQILDYNNALDRKEIELSLSQGDRKIQQIEGFLRSRNARDIQIAVPMLREKILGLIANNNTLDREFRFCVNRLETMARNKALAERIDFAPINDRVIVELVEQPWSTDMFARYLESARLQSVDLDKLNEILLDDDRCIYEWQSFYLWSLLTRYKHKNEELLRRARSNIERHLCAPVTAASCLYLGALGDMNDRKFIAENFKRFNDHLTQRFALIAVKDLSYEAIIKPHVHDYVLSFYKGSYKKLSVAFKSQFQIEPEEIKESEIYEELPDIIS